MGKKLKERLTRGKLIKILRESYRIWSGKDLIERRKNRQTDELDKLYSLSQKELAERDEGSVKTIANLERGKHTTRETTWAKLKKALDIPSYLYDTFDRAYEDIEARVEIFKKLVEPCQDFPAFLYLLMIWLDLDRQSMATLADLDPDTIGRAMIGEGSSTETLNKLYRGYRLPKIFREVFIDAFAYCAADIKKTCGNPYIDKIWKAIQNGLYSPQSPQIPASSISFFGREALLKSLRAKLEECNVIGIHGQPGIGLTELAQELARQTAHQFRGGCAYISIKDCQHKDILLSLLQQFYPDLDVEKDGWLQQLDSEELQKLVEDTLQCAPGGNCLLIIDDVTSSCHVKYLVDMLKHSPPKAMIVSHKPRVLRGLKIDNPFQVDDLETEAAIEILKERSGQYSMKLPALYLKWGAEKQRNKPRLLHKTGEKIQSCHDYATAKEILVKMIGDDPHYLLMRGYRELGSKEQQAFRWLAIFAPEPAIITDEALKNAWQCLDEKEVACLCDHLKDAGLLDYSAIDASIAGQGNKVLYSLPVPIMHFAQECLDNDYLSTKIEATLAHANYYGGLSDKADDSQLFYLQRAHINKARLNLLKLFPQGVLDEPKDKGLSDFVDFAKGTTYFESFYPSTALERIEFLRRVINTEDTTNVSWFMLHLANAYALRNNLLIARTCYDAIKRGATGADKDSLAYASALIGLGNCDALELKFEEGEFEEDKFDKAVSNLEKGANIAQIKQDNQLRFYALCSLGDIYLRRYNSKRTKLAKMYREFAGTWYEKARKPGLSDLRLQAILERKLGDIYSAKGEVEAAHSHYENSREIAGKVGYTLAVYYAYVNEAELYRSIGNEQIAHQLDTKAESLKAKVFLLDDSTSVLREYKA